jgi:hypothetical protein
VRATWPGFASVHRPGHRPRPRPGACASYPCRRSRTPRRRCLPTSPASVTLLSLDGRRGHPRRRTPRAFVPVNTPVGSARLVPYPLGQPM